MLYFNPPQAGRPSYHRLIDAYRVDETSHVRRLCAALDWSEEQQARAQQRARELVTTVRDRRRAGSGVDAFMHEYELSSQEGVILMCLAEALLRIPDTRTADELIRDKLCSGDWEHHLGHSDSLFVNASTWGMMLSGRMIRPSEEKSTFRRLVQRSGAPVIRQAVRQAMRIMARQFVMGRTIEEALERSREQEARGYRYSYDMLGEAARTDADSQRYLQAYRHAIDAIGPAGGHRGPVESPGLSVKLSALLPRYELSQGQRVLDELLPRITQLAEQARHHDIGLTIDAEEAERLDLSLMVLEALAMDPALAGWDGLGLAVQAYQKRAFDQLDWLGELAERSGHRLMVRLVKGAYWDTEIKRAQERGLDGYPVFTRKACTDVSYLACARKLLALGDRLYPQFATHNAHTVAAIEALAAPAQDFEFQRLHGMGEGLYDQIVGTDSEARHCRVYAPVGSHEDLLPYLVRRLLENGANSSFVNRLVDDRLPVEQIIADPVEAVLSLDSIPHPLITLPGALYPERDNSRGLDLTDLASLDELQRSYREVAASAGWRAEPQPRRTGHSRTAQPVVCPHDHDRTVGQVCQADEVDVAHALRVASASFPGWDHTPVEQRAACLEHLADLLERDMHRLMTLCTLEGGKTVPDALAEVREAVDFCRYYALRSREDFRARELPGPTGEKDTWYLRGRGVFVCISPWNFPLAIFLGQVTAALVTGNSVIAKPAEQTSLIAAAAVELLYEAGIPEDVLHCLPGDGETVGGALARDSRVAGVAFTGSTETARSIHRQLADRDAPIATLIAETGGINAMLVDSSALLEQVVVDVLQSGFQSAGQRCSALRVLLVQEEVADQLMELLAGAMDELVIGDPAALATDVGPLIDDGALQRLQSHVERMSDRARLVKCCELPVQVSNQPGTFFPPHLFEIDDLSVLEREVFGPVIHVLRYSADAIDDMAEAVNGMGYGLTFGIHSRIDRTVQRVCRRIRAGNVYVNRNMIGAVVGVQPFGGTGWSGTGPKAGGPHYLHRFTIEQSVSHDTTAAGGNASLMSLGDQ